MIKMNLYFLNSDDISIIEGTPFLYIKSIKSLIFGDIHFGQENAVFSKNSEFCSFDVTRITNLLTKVFKTDLIIEKIILNGDLKHNTKSVSKQEVNDVKQFSENIMKFNCKLIIVKGNHDLLISYVTKFVSNELKVEVVDYFVENKYLICHGDKEIKKDILTGVHTIVFSHEHPAFELTGSIGEKLKVPAFITLNGLSKHLVILPATGFFTVGNNFPVTDSKQFLSPFLRKYADLTSQKIYPFDEEYGLINLYS
jgi:putative SbcD/Mre11-related phosphoesterase